MVTTIQLSETVKTTLENMKQDRETYEDVIVRMIKHMEKEKAKQEEQLKEEYLEMAEESKRICKEWSHADAEVDWEWEDGD